MAKEVGGALRDTFGRHGQMSGRPGWSLGLPSLFFPWAWNSTPLEASPLCQSDDCGTADRNVSPSPKTSLPTSTKPPNLTHRPPQTPSHHARTREHQRSHSIPFPPDRSRCRSGGHRDPPFPQTHPPRPRCPTAPARSANRPQGPGRSLRPPPGRPTDPLGMSLLLDTHVPDPRPAPAPPSSKSAKPRFLRSPLNDTIHTFDTTRISQNSTRASETRTRAITYLHLNRRS